MRSFALSSEATSFDITEQHVTNCAIPSTQCTVSTQDTRQDALRPGTQQRLCLQLN
jgi:hypothetical protein